MALSRSEVRAKIDLAVEEFDVPEWGGTVLLKALTLKQRRQLTALAAKGGDDADESVTRLAVAMALVDPSDKQPVYNAEDSADMELLSQQDSVALVRIFTHVIEKAGITKKAAETAAKN